MNVHDLMARMAGRKKARASPAGTVPARGTAEQNRREPAPSCGVAALDRAFARLERKKAAHARAQAILAARGRAGEDDEEWARAMKRLGRR